MTRVKHLIHDSLEFHVPVTVLENVPFFKNYLEDSSSTPTCLFFPITIDSEKEIISLFFSMVSKDMEIDSFDLTIFEWCELLKISFALGCDDYVHDISKKIGEMYLSMNLEEMFEITLSREFFEKSRDPVWKKNFQENMVRKSKPDDFTTCVFSLPDVLKKKIHSLF